MTLDHEFHTKIRSVCTNKLLRSTSEKYYYHVSRMWAHTQAKVTNLAEIIETLEDMVDGLENKDEEKLLNAIVLHTKSFLDQIQTYLLLY